MARCNALRFSAILRHCHGSPPPVKITRLKCLVCQQLYSKHVWLSELPAARQHFSGADLSQTDGTVLQAEQVS